MVLGNTMRYHQVEKISVLHRDRSLELNIEGGQSSVGCIGLRDLHVVKLARLVHLHVVGSSRTYIVGWVLVVVRCKLYDVRWFE